jgi:DNA-directed RNA polymerase specialized sigma subunit
VNPLPFAQQAVYMSLDDTDKAIFDYLTGSNGKKQMSAKAIALMLGISPAAVSQHASRIGQQISEVANYG